MKYFAIFKLSFIHTLKNYKALIGLSIFLITCLLIFANLWKIAATKIGAVDLNPDLLLWYIAFNEWVLVSLPHVHEDMEEDLRSGRLAYILPRPISYLGSTFAEAMGALSVNLIILGIVTFAFSWWQVGTLPFQASGLAFSIVFGIMAGVVAVLFKMIIGLSAFWLREVSPFFWVWEKLLFMFGGLMLPLAVYPKWMQTMAQFTPFPAILGERSALALDFNLQSVTHVFLSLTLWGAFSLLALFLMYRKGLKILNVEGG